MSQLRKFLAGHKDVQRNYPTDILIWLNYEGYKYAQVKGKPADSMIRRDDHASVSLEKYLSKFVEYLFHPEMSRMKKEELYVRFTNRMDKEDAEIVYLATEGKLQFDLDTVRAYAGDRKVGDDPNGALVFRDEYLVAVPEPAVEPKKKAAAPAGALDGLGESLQSIDPGQDEDKTQTEQKPAEKSVKKPEEKPAAQPEKKGRGRGKKSVPEVKK